MSGYPGAWRYGGVEPASADGRVGVSGPLVLSLFPGIGLLDMAFEEMGFSVVRGPDPLWGGDIHRFRVPPGRFDGVIGGPPCQAFSVMQAAVSHRPTVNLIPEFERVVYYTAPDWFVMENVRGAPLPAVAGYHVHAQLLNNRWLGEEQTRLRRFSFGTVDGRRLSIDTVALEASHREYCVVGGHGGIDHGRQKYKQGTQDVPKMCRLQGLPEDFFAHSPFTVHNQRKMLGNGVPLPMGRAIAKAVRAAMYPDWTEKSA